MARSLSKGKTASVENLQDTQLANPDKEAFSFELPQDINRFKLYGDKLFISSGDSVFIYDATGNRLSSFPVKQNVRDIALGEGEIYILYPARIEVYTKEGKSLREWEACSELSDYCSFTLTGNLVFVTDAENKNICKYTQDGNFVQFIKSPNGFIIPSYSFDIDSYNDTIYCVNSGRHLIETYSLCGEFIAAFGEQGGEEGSFAGCCNPVYISFTSEGELITSEKGNPRISVFERNGNFCAILFDVNMWDGGTFARQMQVSEKNIYIANGKTISVYDRGAARRVPAGKSCNGCPMQKECKIN
jgi:hypothetical protein